MYFNWPLFRTVVTRGLFHSRGTHLRLTAKRIKVLVLFFPLFAFMQLFTRISWACDSLLADRRRARPSEHRPLFILGNFRSGTTFLYRTLAKDTKNFAAMKTWEIYLAPTRIQRMLYRGILAADAAFGAPILRALRRFDSEQLGAVEFHKVGLWEAEEDEGLLLYPWAGLFVWFFFPYRHAVRDFIRYDERVNPRLRRRLDRYYVACIEKHLASHPESCHYLAKNPSFCGKVQMLRRLYPNARFVFLQRDPVAQFRSQMSWLAFAWDYFADPMERYPFQRFALRMAEYWTSHAVESLSTLPADRVCFVRMEELVASPKKTIEDLYRRLGYELSPEFAEVIAERDAAARRHRQNETVELAELSITEAEIRGALTTEAFERQRRTRNAWIH